MSCPPTIDNAYTQQESIGSLQTRITPLQEHEVSANRRAARNCRPAPPLHEATTSVSHTRLDFDGHPQAPQMSRKKRKRSPQPVKSPPASNRVLADPAPIFAPVPSPSPHGATTSTGATPEGPPQAEFVYTPKPRSRVGILSRARYWLPLSTVFLAVGLTALVPRCSTNSPRAVARRTCVARCPLNCTSALRENLFDNDALSSLITMATSMPSRSIGLHRPLVDHLELVRELYSTQGPHLPEQARVHRDVDTLILALYLRSLPPPSLQAGLERGHLALPSSRDPRVRSVVATLLATEELQRTLANGKLPARETSLSSVLNRLEHSSLEYPRNFFASAAWVVAAHEGTQSDSPDIENDLTALASTEVLQNRLVSALYDYLSLEPEAHNETASSGQLLDKFMRCFDVASLDYWQTQVVLLGLNNWIDLECFAVYVQGRSPQLDERFLRSIHSVRAAAETLKVPTCTLLTFDITHMEYRCASGGWTLDGHASELRAELVRVLKILESERALLGSGSVDGEEAWRLIAYLREGSPYLGKRWTPTEFDRLLRKN